MRRCLVGEIRLGDLPDSPLKLGEICGQTVVVGDHYEDQSLGVFLPDGAIIPDQLAEEMWVRGKLAGKQRNRVKVRIMAGILSEGLFYGSRYFVVQDGKIQWIDSPSWNPDWRVGDDVTEQLGVAFSPP